MTDQIELIFTELQRLGTCTSRSSFSTDWLGREDGYYRTVQAKGQIPSIHAHAYLAAQLRTLGMYLAHCEFPTLVVIGNRYLELYGECLEGLLNRVQLETPTLNAYRPAVIANAA